MVEREEMITTPDGEMLTFIFHPEHDGPHPVVLYLMDAPSIRPALKDMASRLATAGYYVMLPYLFYRGGPFREFGMSDEDMHQRRELMGTVTPTNIIGDGEALLGVAEADPNARDGKVAAVGFCMSGGLTIALAKAMPDRIAAAASIHGAWLVRDTPDSPHLDLDGVQAEVYFAWCDNDETAPADTIPVITAALDAAGVVNTVDFLTEAEHGFAPPDRGTTGRRRSCTGSESTRSCDATSDGASTPRAFVEFSAMRVDVRLMIERSLASPSPPAFTGNGHERIHQLRTEGRRRRRPVADRAQNLRGDVWVDARLAGGQDWWNTILEAIRKSDLFVLAVSESALASEAADSRSITPDT